MTLIYIFQCCKLICGTSRLIEIQRLANFCTVVSSSLYRPYFVRNKFLLTLTLVTAIFVTSTHPARIAQLVYWQGHGWEDRGTIVRLLAGTLDFSLLHNVQSGSEAYTAHGSVVTGRSFPKEMQYLSWSSFRLYMRGAILALPPCLHDMQKKFNLLFSVQI